ncbi:MAG TPA: alpha/beta fold hydrolase [Candidatus Methylacidiphilales bacterium]|jgi:pimeloyl-ACP methyl ester carboxylesterase|nr:alpha/beta fold hydrolase [Candidatus Methylacidiphilales bacterium]
MSPIRLDPAWAPSAGSRATIVFVHGAIVRGWEMRLMRLRLKRLGYDVRQFRYRSMMLGLDENVRRLRKFLRETEGDVLHVVGHSMGGVLSRLAFEQDADPRPGRIVAIGSPLLDCWVARRFLRMHPRIGRLLIGRTVADHISRPADPVWHGARDIGVLAGTFRFGIGAIFKTLPSPSDGVVLLEETQLQGIRDRVEYRLNHFGMLFSRRCTVQVARFLATGCFLQPQSASRGESDELAVAA